jgi:DNA polymerase-3 subunit epsilon
MPPQLGADAMERIPEAPGVYLFYGPNALPLYVGKSVNLRERVASHFSSDYRSANDMRISAEITRIEIEQTAGELGALLRESRLVKTLLPSHNHRLRRRRDMVALSLADDGASLDYVNSASIDPANLGGLYGPYPSRAGARAALRDVAREARLCWSTLGLDRREGPCFARQLGRCSGACVGAETLAAHAARLTESLAAHALHPWPYPGMIAVRESDVLSGRTDVHVFRNWCWLGSASDDAALQAILESTPRPEFDLDIYRLLVKRLPRLRPIHIAA